MKKPRRRSFAKAYVIVRHLLDGRYRSCYGGELIAEARGTPPVESTSEPRSVVSSQAQRDKARQKRRQG